MPSRHRFFYVVNGERREELVNGKWVKATGHAKYVSHNLIRDQLGDGVRGIYNPATNRRYDSRSRYYADTRAAGCEVVGGDTGHRSVPKAKVAEPLETTIERLNQQNGWDL